MRKVKVRFSEATYDTLERVRAEEGISLRDVATKALQSIGIVHAYIREGKVVAALDGATRDFRSVIEIPHVPYGDETVRDPFLRVSDEIHRGLTRIAGEMRCHSVEDVFCRGVALYEKIREHRSKGMSFGAVDKFPPHALYAELFIPGITVL